MPQNFVNFDAISVSLAVQQMIDHEVEHIATADLGLLGAIRSVRVEIGAYLPDDIVLFKLGNEPVGLLSLKSGVFVGLKDGVRLEGFAPRPFPSSGEVGEKG